MKIGIACDHAGYRMKEVLIGYLEAMDYTVVDCGCDSEQSVDYPDYAHKLAVLVEAGASATSATSATDSVELGVALCGSANGISMTLNKHQGVRAALCWKPEIATLARQHNDANVCSLPARYLSDEEAIAILDAFLSAKFEGGRHQARVDKIAVR